METHIYLQMINVHSPRTLAHFNNHSQPSMYEAESGREDGTADDLPIGIGRIAAINLSWNPDNVEISRHSQNIRDCIRNGLEWGHAHERG